MKKNQGIIVKLLVFSSDESEIFMLKTKNGYWDLPGGHLEFGETPEEGLSRETIEETGVEAKIERLSSIFTIILDLTDRKLSEQRHYTVLAFRGRLKNKKQISLSDPKIISSKLQKVSDIIGKKSLNIVCVTRDQIIAELDKKPIRATKKFYIKGGELEAYKILGY